VYCHVSICIDEKILGIWYVKLGDDLDVMIALMRADAGYEVRGRTRQYLGDPEDPWDEKDRKRWFGGGVIATTDAEAVKKAREHMVTMATGFAVTFTPAEPPQLFELVRGEATLEKFAEVLKSMPWAHSMEATTH
jgi:hypothetical protein